MFLVIMLRQILEDCSRFENYKVVSRAIDEGRYLSIGVQLDEPRLPLNAFGKVKLFEAFAWRVSET